MRDLTVDEQEVLDHTVIDGPGWWLHVQTVMPARAEEALAAKTAKWRPSLDDAKARDGAGYKRRADRPDMRPAAPPRRP